MAAGRGFRLSDGELSKPMFEVFGKPLIQHSIDLLNRAEVEELVVTARPNDHRLIDHLEQLEGFGKVHIIPIETQSAFESFRALQKTLCGRDHLVLACDVLIQWEAFFRFLGNAKSALLNSKMCILVSELISDDKPIWVEFSDDGHVTRYGKRIPQTGFVFGNIRAIRSDFAIPATASKITSLSELMSHIVDQGDIAIRVIKDGPTIDIDRIEDVKSWEEFVNG